MPEPFSTYFKSADFVLLTGCYSMIQKLFESSKDDEDQLLRKISCVTMMDIVKEASIEKAGPHSSLGAEICACLENDGGTFETGDRFPFVPIRSFLGCPAYLAWCEKALRREGDAGGNEFKISSGSMEFLSTLVAQAATFNRQFSK